jgi:hypothetical protein
MRLKLTLVLLFFLPFSANAIEFELPSGSNVDQAQLQDVDDDYDTVCDSALSSSCDVPAGQYQVVVYRLNWSQVERTPIELVDPAASTSITYVSDVDVSRPNLGDAPSVELTCPLGWNVVGVVVCTSVWRNRDFPNTVVSQAATGIGGGNDSTASCFHLVGPNDPYETLELVTSAKAACMVE